MNRKNRFWRADAVAVILVLLQSVFGTPHALADRDSAPPTKPANLPATSLQALAPMTVGEFVDRLKVEGRDVDVSKLDLKAPLTEGAVIAIGEGFDLHFTTHDAGKGIPRDRIETLVSLFTPEGAQLPPGQLKRQGPPDPFPGKGKGKNHSPHDPNED